MQCVTWTGAGEGKAQKKEKGRYLRVRPAQTDMKGKNGEPAE